jgi:hypothetical protein
MPRADRSDPAPRALDARIWRAVESQHVISTMRLVGHVPGDQAILEEILEAAKPPVPAAARHLHWLLATPFRYAPVAGGSRFRARGDPGVFYGAAEVRTACAEAGYWKWRFVRDSAGLSALEAHPMTLFPARVRGSAWNLMRPPFAARRAQWMDPVDYAPTQALARRARSANVEALVYASVRDPAGGECTAVLSPAALVDADPMPRAQSWFLTVLADGVVWQREGAAGHRFDFTAFAA